LVAKGKSLDLVSQAETLEAHRNLREDLWRSSWAYYVAELADAFIRDEDPHALLFDLVLDTLRRLDRGEEVAMAVRYCELHLLSLAGYQPQFFRCVQCGELLGAETNFLSLERGGALCPQHGAHQAGTLVLPLSVLKVLRFLQTRPWEQVSRLRPSREVSRQVEGLLEQYIAFHLERGLHSPVFLLRLRQSLTPDADP
jgi:DNA repair protein RecO (recombination protein O)